MLGHDVTLQGIMKIDLRVLRNSEGELKKEKRLQSLVYTCTDFLGGPCFWVVFETFSGNFWESLVFAKFSCEIFL